MLYSRKQLPPVYPHVAPPSAATAPLPFPARDAKLDANVVMVLLVLLCALICSLALNSILRFIFTCSGFVPYPNSSNNNNSHVPETGIKKRTLKRFPTVRYSADPCLSEECVICLSEFKPGERVRLLPNCNHGFHVSCIDKWLNSHSSCPTCRHCLTDHDTCQKKPVLRADTRAVTMTTMLPPLEHEGMMGTTM